VVSRIALLAGSLILCALLATVSWAAAPQRIVSLVPSVTEMLFAIGAGPRVVGVSSYDHEPPAVERLPRVGALMDPDLERILSLRPDLVAIYGSQTELATQLERAGIRTFPYRHGGVQDVFVSLRSLGDAVGRRAEAEDVVERIEGELAAVRAKTKGGPHPRVLLVFGREPLSLRGIYASGGTGFLHDLIGIAGGVNVFADIPRESVQVTTELILARAPEVILEVRADPMPTEEVAREKAVWKALAGVPAVRSGRVDILIGSELVVPGPRLGRAAERLAAAIHAR
jgi:iron complex transport system substrate-binding protein